MPALLDHAPQNARFTEEALLALQSERPFLPCKFFYDRRGSLLFDRICELDEYYPTRTERGILEAHAGDMAARLGPACRLIEYGSGSSLKTRVLLDSTPDLACYVPVDISRDHLCEAAGRLSAAYPTLEILPVCADYTMPFALPGGERRAARSAVFFPGSTVGNFAPAQAQAFLARIAELVGPDGGLLIGVDLKKDASVLERAYNDREGVTAAFNLNVLHHLNREAGADFDLNGWEHWAFYNVPAGRIEMHLVSLRAQAVHLNDVAIDFAADDTIHTEYSYKYALPEFAALAESAGFQVRQVWTDPQEWFSVQYLEVNA